MGLQLANSNSKYLASATISLTPNSPYASGIIASKAEGGTCKGQPIHILDTLLNLNFTIFHATVWFWRLSSSGEEQCRQKRGATDQALLPNSFSKEYEANYCGP